MFAIEKHPDQAQLGFVINTEVPMLKAHRRLLAFDSLEGKVLLSIAMADPAVTVHQSATKRLVLNGSLQGLPTGSFGSKGLAVTSFPVSGHLGSMGKVSGFFLLSDKVVARGKLPDLSNSLLILTNQKGSLLLGIKHSIAKRYSFQLLGVTRQLLGATTHATSVSGSGFLTISPSPSTFNLIIAFHSAQH